MSRKAKYNPKDVQDIAHWIEDILGEKLPSNKDNDPILALKDGVVLCKLVNTILPQSAKFKQSNMPFVQMENIAAFLRAAVKIGVAQHELFETVDLYDMRDPVQVSITLRSLSRHANVLDPSLPVIGPKLQGSVKSPELGGLSSPKARNQPTPMKGSIKEPEPEPEPKADKDPEPTYTKTEQQVLQSTPSTSSTPVKSTPMKSIHIQTSPAKSTSTPESARSPSIKSPSIKSPPAKSPLDTLPTLSIDLDNSPLVKPDNSLISEGDSSIQAEEPISVKPIYSPSPLRRNRASEPESEPPYETRQPPRFSPPSDAQTSDEPPRKSYSQSPTRVPVGSRTSPVRAQSPTKATNHTDDDYPTRPPQPQGPAIALSMRPPKPKGPRTYVPSPNMGGGSVFGNDDDEDEDRPGAPYQSSGSNDHKEFPDTSPNEDGECDPSIYEYDEVYDAMKTAEREAHKNADHYSDSKKPRYINNLLKSKNRREKDRQMAHDLMLTRERETEGSEFDDKEMFITSAYKQKQEEASRQRKLEEELAAESQSDSMSSFHRNILDTNDEIRSKVVAAVSQSKTNPKPNLASSANTSNISVHGSAESLTEKARRINEEAGYEKVKINDNGELVDSTQLLSAGLNIPVTASSAGSIHRQSDVFTRDKGSYSSHRQSRGPRDRHEYRNRHRDTQVNTTTATLEQPSRTDLDHKEKLKALWKSKKVDDQEISSAKQRYLARKRAAEEASQQDSLPHK